MPKAKENNCTSVHVYIEPCGLLSHEGYPWAIGTHTSTESDFWAILNKNKIRFNKVWKKLAEE